MAKYAVSLGAISRTVTLEAANAQQALNNVLTLVEPHGIAMIPRMDQKDSHWFSRNVENPKDEVLVKDTDAARKMVAAVRKDVVDVFWFVSLHEEKNGRTRRIK